MKEVDMGVMVSGYVYRKDVDMEIICFGFCIRDGSR